MTTVDAYADNVSFGRPRRKSDIVAKPNKQKPASIFTEHATWSCDV